MKELDKGLEDDSSTLAKFVLLARYFNPRDQLDSKSPFAVKTVNAEKIFAKLIGEFNPYGIHQDCHEFLVLLLDKLHDEMALLGDGNHASNSSTADDEKVTQKAGAGEWNEIGEGN
jgi:ubiquitin C-terminal hydrolase